MNTIIFILFIFFQFSSPTFSKENPRKLIYCLAKEEELFHKKKIQSPDSKLNFELFSLFSQTYPLDLSPQMFHQICSNLSQSPGRKLLFDFIKYDGNIFQFDNLTRNKERQLSMITELKNLWPGLFFRYVSLVQAEMKDPNCIKKKFPELNELFLTYQYVEEESSFDNFKSHLKKIEKFRSSLNQFMDLKKSCNQDSSRSSRGKKKQNSNPTGN